MTTPPQRTYADPVSDNPRPTMGQFTTAMALVNKAPFLTRRVLETIKAASLRIPEEERSCKECEQVMAYDPIEDVWICPTHGKIVILVVEEEEKEG